MDTRRGCHGIEKWMPQHPNEGRNWEGNTQAQCLGIQKLMPRYPQYASSMPRHRFCVGKKVRVRF